MPHEISKTPDGRDAMAYVGRSPWHRLGTELAPSQAKDLDLALRAAGLGFEVVKRPRHTMEWMDPVDPGPADVSRDGVRYRVKRGKKPFAVVRSDTGTELGTVDEAWHPLQNGEAFEPLRDALDRGLASIETAGVLREGKEVWTLVRFDRDHVLRTARDRAGSRTDPAYRRLLDTFEGEPGGGILPYGLLYNDHSGRRHARVQQTAVRVVCANTLEWSLGLGRGPSVEVPHEGNVRHAYRSAVEAMFRELADGYQALADQREVLKKTVLSEEDFNRLVGSAALLVRMSGPVLVRGRDRPDRPFYARDRRPWTEMQARVRRLWTDGAGHRGDRSAWEAYNGLIQWLDHAPAASPDEDRLEGLLTGTLGDAKRRVYAQLLAHATGEEGVAGPSRGVLRSMRRDYWENPSRARPAVADRTGDTVMDRHREARAVAARPLGAGVPG